MLTQSQAARMLSEFEDEVRRKGYESTDKRALANVFGALKVRLANPHVHPNSKKLDAVRALEKQWHQDRIGKPILGDQDQIMGYDPAGTQGGALTISSILERLRKFIPELPVKIDPPKPIVIPAVIAPSQIGAAVDAAVAKALAARDAAGV